MERLRRVWKDPVWSKVIAGAITTAGIAIYAFVNERFARWIADSASFIGNSLARPTTIPAWSLILVVVVSAVLPIAILFLLSRRQSEQLAPSDPHQDYRDDIVFDFRWRWSFGYDQRAFDITMYCPRCDYELKPRMFEGSHAEKGCYRCSYKPSRALGYVEDEDHLTHAVALEVERRARSEEWKNSGKRLQELAQ